VHFTAFCLGGRFFPDTVYVHLCQHKFNNLLKIRNTITNVTKSKSAARSQTRLHCSTCRLRSRRWRRTWSRRQRDDGSDSCRCGYIHWH